MWNTFDTSVNGGFMESSQGSASKKKQNVRRVQSLVPLFISYINESTDEEFTLLGMPVQMVDIVGVLKDFDVQSTKLSCTVQDHSGSIQAILWFESDGDSINAVPPVKENCYVRVFGSIRTQDAVRMIMILKVIPIDDLNVITHHHMKAIYARICAQKYASGEKITTIDRTNTSMSYNDIKDNGSTGEGMRTLNSMQTKIMNLLKDCTAFMGMSRTEILKYFSPQEAQEVKNTLAFLLDEGFAYTTRDLDHFKATDGF